MGILDRFFGRKNQKKENDQQQNMLQKDITENEQNAAAQAEKDRPAVTAAPEASVQSEQAMPDANAVRSLAVRMLKKDIRTIEGQLALIEAMAEIVTDVPKADLEQSARMLWEKKEGFQPAAAIGQLATGVSARTGRSKLDTNKLETAGPDVLLQGWAALDLYGMTMKAPAGAHLLSMRDALVPVMMKRKMLTIRQTTALEKLVIQCAKLEKEKAPQDEIRNARRAIWTELKQSDLLIAFDEDYNAKFPYFGPDGMAWIFASPEVGKMVQIRTADNGDGHFTVRKLKSEQADLFTISLRMTGVPAIRIFLQAGVCILPFTDFDPLPQGNLLDQGNRMMRGLAIRTLQFNARMNKLNASMRAGEKQKFLLTGMLTMRANLCRELGNGLFYVLGPAPYMPGVTLYTPDALKRAHALLEAGHLPEEALIAPGDRSIAAYEGKLALRAVNMPGQTELEKSLVCAFTQRDVCEGARKHFEKSGSGDSVVVVTWDELRGQAESCAGVILDQGALGMMIPEKWFADVERFRQSPNPISVNLKENGKPPEAKA